MNENEARGAAIDRAASELPEGWEVHIITERNAGVAVLVDPDGEIVDFGSDYEYLSDEINDAIDHAKEKADE